MHRQRQFAFCTFQSTGGRDGQSCKFYTYSQNYFLGVGVRLIESDNFGRSPIVIKKTDAVSMRLFFLGISDIALNISSVFFFG